MLSIRLLTSLSLPLSLHFNAIFQVNLRQQVFIETKNDGGGGDNWTTEAIHRAKPHSNHHHQQTNIQFFYRPDAFPVAQLSVKALKGNITFHGLAYPKLTWGLIAPGNLGEGCHALISPLMPVPHNRLLIDSRILGLHYGTEKVTRTHMIAIAQLSAN